MIYYKNNHSDYVYIIDAPDFLTLLDRLESAERKLAPATGALTELHKHAEFVAFIGELEELKIKDMLGASNIKFGQLRNAMLRARSALAAIKEPTK